MAQQIPFSFFGQGETVASLGLLSMVETNVELTNFDTSCEVTDEGGGTVTDTGICWSTSFNPTIADNFKSSGSGGVGPFTVDILDIDGLLNDTTYYFRAYATNLYGQSYSNEVVQNTSYVPFITEWTTAAPGDDINIMRNPSGANHLLIDAYVDWGDGSAIENITGNTGSTILHTYTVAGTYDVKISGLFPRISMGLQDELTEIKQWGTQPWKYLAAGFEGSHFMNCIATDVPVIIPLELNTRAGLVSMFKRNIAFGGPFVGNPSFASWNVSGIEDFGQMFRGTSFNQDISSWNMSSAIDLGGMFAYCTSFNQDISSWNVSNVISFNTLFRLAASFNQNLDSWNVSSGVSFSEMFYDTNITLSTLSSWDTSSATSFLKMYQSASHIHSGISSWNTSNLETIDSMFNSSTGVIPNITGWTTSSIQALSAFANTNFNQNISGWDTSSVTNIGQMFQNNTAINQNFGSWDITNVTAGGFFRFMDNVTTLSTANYDAILIGWEAQGPVSNISTIYFGTTQYTKAPSPAATAHASLLSTYNWTIIDGGPTP